MEEGEYAEALMHFDHWESMCPTFIPDDYREIRAKAESSGIGKSKPEM
jgi:hypothetical protein